MSGEAQTRKRKDRKKKRGDREVDIHEILTTERNDEDSSSRDDLDDSNHSQSKSHSHHHHEGPVSWIAIVVFVLLSAGLVAVTGLIFLELRGSKEVDTPIAESRYASVLEYFVDDSLAGDDHHDDHEHTVDHGDHDEEDHEEGGSHDHDEEEPPHTEMEHEEDSHRKPVDEPEVIKKTAYITGDEETEQETPQTPQGTESEIWDLFWGGLSTAEQEPTESQPEAPTTEPELPLGPDLAAPSTENIFDNIFDDVFRETIVEPLQDIWDDGEPAATEEEQTEDPEQIDGAQEDAPEVDSTEDESKDDTLEDDNNDNAQIDDNAQEEGNDDDNTDDKYTDPEDDADDEFLQDQLDESDDRLPPEQSSSTEPEESINEEETVIREKEDDSVDSGIEDEEIELISESPPQELNEINDDWSDGVTNDYDFNFKDELDEADREFERTSLGILARYEALLQRYPLSPRATYGKARALDSESQTKQSNPLLEQSIEHYMKVLELPDVPEKLYRLAGDRCVDRMRFRGWNGKASQVQQLMLTRFPKDTKIMNSLAVSYLYLGRNQVAKNVLKQVLTIDPNNGFAKVHYGFILKVDERNNAEGAHYLQEGIESEAEGTQDGKFYFHLGMALQELGKDKEAYQIYEKAVTKGLFRSVYQRSLYNVDSLTSRPWWTPEQTTYQDQFKVLEDNWKIIRDEALRLLDSKQLGFELEKEGLTDRGVWKQFDLFMRGVKISQNCALAPKTCKLLEEFPDASSCKRGQAKFSIMHPKTHIWPHCGPTNCRLRAHLGLKVPNNVKMRVANETRTWKEGKFLIFDDSFEHEVWHDGDSFRLILIVDVWHPELSQQQRRSLTPI